MHRVMPWFNREPENWVDRKNLMEKLLVHSPCRASKHLVFYSNKVQILNAKNHCAILEIIT